MVDEAPDPGDARHASSPDPNAGERPVDLPPPVPEPRPLRHRARLAGGLLLVLAVGGVALWLVGRSVSPGETAVPTSGVRPAPLIAVVDTGGSLAVIDQAGRRRELAASGAQLGFPAWSPDGARLAAITAGAGGPAISVFAVTPEDLAPSPPESSAPAPRVIYRSAAIPPFYLSWTPDGQRVSFLATEADGISLRIAPADGSAPLDGSAPGAVIRRGAPLYFDWIGRDRLMLHVGSGADAFLGEVGADGAVVGPAHPDAGNFRPAVVSADGRLIAFVRGQVPSAAVIVAGRDGSGEHAVPVFGPAAVTFDPSGSSLAVVAPDRAIGPALAFPSGPLRLVDPASGTIRTLLDGTVVGFFWSPDGNTIAALRLQQASGSTTADRGIVSVAAIRTAEAIRTAPAIAAADPSAPAAGPAASATTPPGAEVHLVFVEVGTGAIRSDRVIRPSALFVDQFLPFFDQYALSHRVWAPDSSAVVLPVVDQAGRSQVVVVRADGGAGPPPIADAVSGFWSP